MSNQSFSHRKKQGSRAELMMIQYMDRTKDNHHYEYTKTGSEEVFPLLATNQFRVSDVYDPYRYMPDFLITSDIQDVFWIEVKAQSKKYKHSCSIEREAFEWYMQLDTHTPVYVAVVSLTNKQAFLYRVSDIVFTSTDWIDGKMRGSGSPNFFNFIDARISKVTKIIDLGVTEDAV